MSEQVRTKLLKINQVAAWTGVPENTLRFWRARGEGGPPSGRVGKRVMYREEDVQAWIDAQFQAGA